MEFEDDDWIYDMYNSSAKKAPSDTSKEEISNKSAARIMGGMKAAGVHTVAVEVDGQIYSVPRSEYIKTLEINVKELRQKVARQEDKISRITRNYNKLVEVIRSMQRDLNNKIDKR